MSSYWIKLFCGWLLVSCSWFCLWVLSYYFILDLELAILFFPFALRLGITLHTSKHFWPAIYGAELLLMMSLAILLEQSQWGAVIVASICSIPITWCAQKFYFGSQLRRLYVMGVVIISIALINSLTFYFWFDNTWIVFLISITGGLMLVPSCYLVWSYLFQNTWIPLTVNLVAKPVDMRSRHIVFYLLLFILNIVVQLGLPDDLRRFAPFCLAIPIILLAFRYGWKGALLGTLLNSVALIAARNGTNNMEITDLLLSLSAQSLTGILLGIGIQRQRELNHQLRYELGRNHSLSRELIKTEEFIRKDIARELHDEIGQNITAIRTQANIIKRVENTLVGERCASIIENLSLNIYDTTKGLLTRLRPKTLDDLGLQEAIHQLIRELECELNGLIVTIIWNDSVKQGIELSDATNVTLYRICQEALNNMIKYAQATEATVELTINHEVHLTIKDNGIGFKQEDTLSGFGLRGMRERVQVLGGKFILTTQSESLISGTELKVVLPML